VKVGVIVLATSLAMGGLVLALAGRTHVHATTVQTEVIGTLGQTEQGAVVIDDGSTTYGVVGAMDFTPFLSTIGAIDGLIVDGTLFATAMTLGLVHLEDQDGIVVIDTDGTVEEGADGYQVTVDGITFTLVGSDELEGAVGHEAQIEGDLVGSQISVTSLTLIE